MRFQRIRAGLIVLLATYMASGCTFLYSEARDKQGQALKEAYSKVDLAGQFTVIRKNRADIITEQSAAIDTLAQVQKKALIQELANSNGPTYTVAERLQRIQQALDVKKLTLSSSEAAGNKLRTEYRDTATVITDETKLIILISQVPYAHAGLVAPSCTEFSDDTGAVKRANAWITNNPSDTMGMPLTAALMSGKSHCAKLTEANKKLAELSTALPPLISSVTIKIIEEKKRITELQAVTKHEREELSKIIDSTTEDKDEKTAAQKVKEKTDKLKNTLEKLQSAQDAYSIQFLAQLKLSSLSDFLSVVSGTKDATTLSETSQRAALVAQLFPSLWDTAKVQFKQASTMDLAPFVLQKKLAQISLDSATREIETRNLKIALLTSQQALLTRLAITYDELGEKVEILSKSIGNKELIDILSAPTEKKAKGVDAELRYKYDTWDTISRYLDAGFRIAPQYEKSQLQLNALEGEIILGYSEANVTQWATLINSEVDQLALYSSLGVKDKQISDFIQNIMLLGIAVGVN